MTQQLQSALRAQIKRISAGYAFSRLGGLATALFLAATATHAAPLVILPNAIAREYFGLNYAIYVQNVTTVGTLNYNGQPGCGGSCIATTQLGADPFASLTVNEVVFNNGSGGGALSWLGYYVEYVNSPGTYMVNLHAAESLSVGDGISQASAYLAFGQASGVTGFGSGAFASYVLQEADCVNGCPAPGFVFTPAGFTADHLVPMIANVPYFILLQLQINPQPNNQQLTGLIDPIFSTTATGGSFVFSPGVTGPASVPEPSVWLLTLAGLACLGGFARWRKIVA